MDERPIVLLVEAKFYDDIAEELAQGAIEHLTERGVDYERLPVPGAFEIPAAIRMATRALDFHSSNRRYAGYVALGCVIRGETSHYDYVCGESARKLQDLACEQTLAIGYGILTCENREQAWARASRAEKNKGREAAKACLDMIEIKRQFRLYPR